MKLKKFILVALAAVMVVGAAGCGSNQQKSDNGGKTAAVSGSITGSGSSALLPLVKDAAEKFKANNKDVTITLNAGGSGTGLKQVSDGSVDMGNSDVPAETKLDKAKAEKLQDHKVCVMTVATIVNKDAGVTNLTRQQLADIFTAKVTNWKDVGGADKPIVLVTRPKTSGTRALFKKYAINDAEEADNKSLETDNSGILVQSVAQNPGAIGYVALPYLINDKTVQTVSIDGVEPTLENTYSGKYGVWGYEHIYTSKEPKAAVKAFLEYITGDEYGKRIEELGYGVSSKMQTKEVH
ncbi:phosphate ABC transporter substrate-binding protein [uncultured Megasphaera sp.]|uniref:phosphate ABC transporter substrate-binding protein n=1 Tax=uncultured Megasphaera sp. TaxID=165188 RepID=UPI00265AA0C8|nr:phosphate ABC transporter substrate-binding protein [uncultured Megasphaera sp.]